MCLRSDDRLAELMRRGDVTASDALTHRYRRQLQLLCAQLLGSHSETEAVLRESIVVIHGAVLAEQTPRNVRPWMFRVVRAQALAWLRRSGQAAETDRGGTGALQADFRSLPEPQRTALLLRDSIALDYEEIAEALESDVDAVQAMLVAARVALAEAAMAREAS